MLSILLNYGAELGLPACLDLARVLERMTLRVPQPVRKAWKHARPKKLGMSYEQAAAIVAEACDAEHGLIARWRLALQLNLNLLSGKSM